MARWQLTRRGFLRTTGAAGFLIGCQGAEVVALDGGADAPDGSSSDGALDAGGLASDASEGTVDSGTVDSQTPVFEDAGTGADAGTMDATLACDETADQVEGPYYLAGAPAWSDPVAALLPGTPFTLKGRVLGTACEPIAGAVLDIWHCNDAGIYSESPSWEMRGTLVTDASGRYELKTIVPPNYPFMSFILAQHIHFKVGASGYVALTTQLYFEGDPEIGADIPAPLIMTLTDAGDGKTAEFDFVLSPIS